MKSKYTLSELKPLLAGAVNMTFTPFRADNSVDVEALRDNTNWMIDQGIVAGSGVQMIGGQVGSGHFLTDEDYRILIDTIVEEARGRVPIGVGTIRLSTYGVVELGKYAEEAGADFLLVMPPYYNGNVAASADTVLEHYHALASVTTIPIMIHNDPRTTGQSLSWSLIEQLCEIPQIIAYKEDRQEFNALRELCLRFKDRLMINANSYKCMIPLDYLSGVTGHNSFLANVDPALALEQHEIAESGDFARAQELWLRTLDLYNYITIRPGYLMECGKEMARIAGRPMGEIERLPHHRPGPEERAKLRELMIKARMPVA